jgi:pSer/pThr/pTyr-binding forkhead associated (FHA) protein
MDTTATGVRIQGQTAGVSGRHCALQRQGREVVLNDFSTSGTFVDETRVDGSTVVKLGQKIRVGTPGEVLQLIVCLDSNAA